MVTSSPRGRRLASFIGRSDGIPFETAIDRADVGLAVIRPEAELSLDAAVERLRECVSHHADAPPPEALRDVLSTAVHIAGHAGMFEREELGQAAYSLCLLVDEALSEGRAVDQQALRLHIQTLELLNRPSALSQVQRTKMVEALGALLAHARAEAPRPH